MSKQCCRLQAFHWFFCTFPIDNRLTRFYDVFFRENYQLLGFYCTSTGKAIVTETQECLSFAAQWRKTFLYSVFCGCQLQFDPIFETYKARSRTPGVPVLLTSNLTDVSMYRVSSKKLPKTKSMTNLFYFAQGTILGALFFNQCVHDFQYKISIYCYSMRWEFNGFCILWVYSYGGLIFKTFARKSGDLCFDSQLW